MALTRTKAHEETHHLGHVKLHRDELQQIIRAVAEIGEPVIEGPGFQATAEEDLADPEVPEKLEWITITARQGGHQLQVAFSRRSAVAETTEPNTLLHGVLSRVIAVCQASGRWGRAYSGAIGWKTPALARRDHRTNRRFAAVACVAAVLLFIALAWSYADGNPPSAETLLAVGGVVPVLWVAWEFRKPSSAVLINACRADRPTFWQRKRDDLIINAVVLVLGAVLGGVVTKIMG